MREIAKYYIELRAASIEKLNSKTVHQMDKVFYPLLPQVNTLSQMSFFKISFSLASIIFRNLGS